MQADSLWLNLWPRPGQACYQRKANNRAGLLLAAIEASHKARRDSYAVNTKNNETVLASLLDSAVALCKS